MTRAERNRERARRGGLAARAPAPARGNPATTQMRSYTDSEIEFGRAMERYKRLYHCPYPTWADVLVVARELGYRLVAEPAPLPVTS